MTCLLRHSKALGKTLRQKRLYWNSLFFRVTPTSIPWPCRFLAAFGIGVDVFDEDGDDLQPVILSEFQIVQCSPLSDVNSARQSLAVEQVRAFARVLRA